MQEKFPTFTSTVHTSMVELAYDNSSTEAAQRLSLTYVLTPPDRPSRVIWKPLYPDTSMACQVENHDSVIEKTFGELSKLINFEKFAF